MESSRNIHEMRLSDKLGMGLLVSPSLLTYIANIRIWRGSVSLYSSMFWVTLAGDSTFFWGGGDIEFHDAHMIYVS